MLYQELRSARVSSIWTLEKDMAQKAVLVAQVAKKGREK